MNDIHQPWNKWDRELNNHGGWLLVGALACASLPAIPGSIGLIFVLTYAVIRSQPKADEIFKRRNELKRRYEQGVATAQEKEEYYTIMGSLGVNQNNRNTIFYKIGYALWFLALAYQFWKLLRANNLTQLFFG